MPAWPVELQVATPSGTGIAARPAAPPGPVGVDRGPRPQPALAAAVGRHVAGQRAAGRVVPRPRAPLRHRGAGGSDAALHRSGWRAASSGRWWCSASRAGRCSRRRPATGSTATSRVVASPPPRWRSRATTLFETVGLHRLEVNIRPENTSSPRRGAQAGLPRRRRPRGIPPHQRGLARPPVVRPDDRGPRAADPAGAVAHQSHQPHWRHTAPRPRTVARRHLTSERAQPSSLIFLVIIAVWAAYFVQYWVRRREHLATARSVDQFSESMRVLERRTPAARASDLSTPVRPLVCREPGPRGPAPGAREAGGDHAAGARVGARRPGSRWAVPGRPAHSQGPRAGPAGVARRRAGPGRLLAAGCGAALVGTRRGRRRRGVGRVAAGRCHRRALRPAGCPSPGPSGAGRPSGAGAGSARGRRPRLSPRLPRRRR